MHPTDQLQIDTPEQIALELQLAGIGSRFLAIAIDTLLQVLAFLALVLGAALLVTGGLFGGMLGGVFGSFAPAVVVFGVFCLYWGYFAFFEAVWKGQTPGKRYAGIRVIKDTGRPINAFESIARNLMRAVDGIPGLYGVALISMLISTQHRRLGDYVAGTVVVHDKSEEDIKPYSVGPGASAAGTTSGSGPTEISSDELLLVETYLHRRFDLDLEVREKTAEEIAARIRAKHGVQPDGTPADSFLEAVAQRTRDGARYSKKG
ncbi:MAG TPA: RDD family protein [Vicinamibacterales bacterium]